jgi:hypothetical protein
MSIYKIINTLNDFVYIGCTTQPLRKRFMDHKNNLSQSRLLKMKLYNAMNELGKDNFKIVLIEKIQYNNRNELRVKEQEYIDKYNSYTNGYNSKCEVRSQKQYIEDNKEKIKANKKIYWENNKERLCSNKREYYLQHKDMYSSKTKIYRENNKTKIKERKSVKHTCDCGATFAYDSKARHEKSKTHINYVSKK